MGADYAAAVKNHHIELLLLNDELVGLIEMIHATDHILIENVAVAPDWQGKGLGHRLMARAEQVARESRTDELRLYTNQRFAENVRLYLKLGYVIDSEEAIAGSIRVNMSKRLPDG